MYILPLHTCKWIQILTECKISPLNTLNTAAVASKLKAKQQAVLQDAIHYLRGIQRAATEQEISR